MDGDALDLETRRRIFGCVQAQPGAYLRELQRAAAMPMGMLEYHLGRLEAAGLVAVEHGDHKRFFPQPMAAADRAALALLRDEAGRRLVLALLDAPDATHDELRRATGQPPSTVSYHLAKLVDGGLATRRRDGRNTRYAVVGAPRVLALLVRHRPSFLDRVLDAFLETFGGPGGPDA